MHSLKYTFTHIHSAFKSENAFKTHLFAFTCCAAFIYRHILNRMHSDAFIMHSYNALTVKHIHTHSRRSPHAGTFICMCISCIHVHPYAFINKRSICMHMHVHTSECKRMFKDAANPHLSLRHRSSQPPPPPPSGSECLSWSWEGGGQLAWC